MLVTDHPITFVVSGPNTLSLLLLVLWQHGTFSCQLLHTLVLQSRVASSQNTMVLFLFFGAMRTFGCLSSWYHSFAICVISCGNSKCLHPFTCKSQFAHLYLSLFLVPNACIHPFLITLFKKSKSTTFPTIDQEWIDSAKLSTKYDGYNVSSEIVVMHSHKTTAIKTRLFVLTTPRFRSPKVNSCAYYIVLHIYSFSFYFSSSLPIPQCQ